MILQLLAPAVVKKNYLLRPKRTSPIHNRLAPPSNPKLAPTGENYSGHVWNGGMQNTGTRENTGIGKE